MKKKIKYAHISNYETDLLCELASFKKYKDFKKMYTGQLAGFIQDDEYMSFGLSGEQGKNSMVGEDVALVYYDEHLGHVEDFNLTAR